MESCCIVTCIRVLLALAFSGTSTDMRTAVLRRLSDNPRTNFGYKQRPHFTGDRATSRNKWIVSCSVYGIDN